jgi:hypothetical protein
MTTPDARCVECRQPARAARRCPDCREPVHQRCQTGHHCAAKLVRVGALAAEMAARLVRYRVVLTLEIDSAHGSLQSWDWPNCLGLHPPERVVVEVIHAGEADSDPDGGAGATTSRRA